MNLTKWEPFKWDPFKELDDMSQRLNRLFGRSAARSEPGTEALATVDWAPSVDISETDSEYIIKAEIPEVKKEDVKVTVEDGQLTIQGERKQEKEEKGKRYHRIERSYGSFMRSFTVPDNADESKAKAEYKDGMLTLTLPKSEKAKPKALEVKVA
jgi:HSP20 family protein